MTQTIWYDDEAFVRAFSPNGGTNGGWNAKDGQAMEYKDWDSGLTYRNWRPDTSACRADLALLVSCKIDQRRMPKDDHAVLIAAFNRDGHAIVAQAAVQHMKRNFTFNTDTIHARGWETHPDAASDDRLATDLEAALREALAKNLKPGKDEGLELHCRMTADTLRAMAHAIRVQ